MAATKEVLEKIEKLVRLAESDNEEEARTAAMQAARLMREHELTVVPKAEFERAVSEMREVRKEIAGARSQKMGNIIMGAIGGFLLAKTLKGGKLKV